MTTSEDDADYSSRIVDSEGGDEKIYGFLNDYDQSQSELLKFRTGCKNATKRLTALKRSLAEYVGNKEEVLFNRTGHRIKMQKRTKSTSAPKEIMIHEIVTTIMNDGLTKEAKARVVNRLFDEKNVEHYKTLQVIMPKKHERKS